MLKVQHELDHANPMNQRVRLVLRQFGLPMVSRVVIPPAMTMPFAGSRFGEAPNLKGNNFSLEPKDSIITCKPGDLTGSSVLSPSTMLGSEIDVLAGVVHLGDGKQRPVNITNARLPDPAGF